jgi:glutamate transport system permease protein
MSTTVLYDAPGPRTRQRQRAYSVVLLVLAAAVAGWVLWKLQQAGEFDPDFWSGMLHGNIWVAIGNGVVATVEAAALAIVLAVALGLVLAVGRLSDRAWVRLPCTWFVEFFRAIPVLLMMIFVFAATGGHIESTETRGLVAVVGGLMLYNGSVLAEVFRAGIRAVPRGQAEAGYAVGMRKAQVMTIVLIPQAVRFMLPAIVSQCVVALKDTSLGFIAAYTELSRQGRSIALFLHNNLMVYVVIALVYVAMNSIVSELAAWLERRMARRGGGSTAREVRLTDEIDEAMQLG